MPETRKVSGVALRRTSTEQVDAFTISYKQDDTGLWENFLQDNNIDIKVCTHLCTLN